MVTTQKKKCHGKQSKIETKKTEKGRLKAVIIKAKNPQYKPQYYKLNDAIIKTQKAEHHKLNAANIKTKYHDHKALQQDAAVGKNFIDVQDYKGKCTRVYGPC